MSLKALVRITWRILGLSLLVLFLLVLTELMTFIAVPILTGENLSTPLSSLNLDFSQADAQDSLQRWAEVLEESEPIFYRTRKIDTRVEGITITYEISVGKTTRLADELVRDQVESDLQSFVRVAFGSITVDDQAIEPLFDEVTWEVQTGQDAIVARFSAQVQDDAYPLISIKPSRTDELSWDFIINQDILTINLQNTELWYISEVPDIANKLKVEITKTYPDVIDRILVHLRRFVDRPTISRQGILRDIGGLTDVRWLRTFVLGVVEFVPLFLIWYLVRKENEGLPYFGKVAQLLQMFITFHFLIYGLNSLAEYLRNADWVTNLSEGGNVLLRYLDAHQITPLFGDSPQVLSVAFLGVLLPSLFMHQAGYQTPTKRGLFARVIQMILSLVLFLAVIGFLVFLLFSTQLPDVSLSPPLWSFYLFFVSVLIILMSIGFRWIYFALWGNAKPVMRSDIPLLTAITVFMLIIVDFTWINDARFLSQWFGPKSAYVIFYIFTIVFGGLLLHSLIYVLKNYTEIASQFAWEKWPTRLAWIVPFLLAVPLHRIVDKNNELAYQTTLLSLAFELDNLIIHLVVLGIVWYLFRLDNPVHGPLANAHKTPQVSEIARSLGLLALALVLFNPGQLWLYIPLRFLTGWFLLTFLVRGASHWDQIGQFFDHVVKKRSDLLEKIANLNTARSAYRDFRKQQKEKLTSGDITIEKYGQSLDQRQIHLDNYQNSLLVAGRPGKEWALAFGPYNSSWQNAMHGVRWSAIFSIPWLLIFFTKFFSAAIGSIPYPLLDFLEDMLSVIGPWLAMGFLMGYFYPYIRGNNGLQKGLWLAGAVILPSILMGVFYNSTSEAWQATLFWALQVFIHCMLLGLIAFDYYILRQGYNDWQLLLEVHGLPEVSISVSALVAAIITAITALLTTQTTGLISNVIKGLLSPDIIQILPK